MALSFGFSKQKSKSEQSSGINPTLANRFGTQVFSDITGQDIPFLHGEVIQSSTPGGFMEQARRLGQNAPLLELDSNDLTSGVANQAESFIDRLMKSQFSKFSAGANLRGQNSVSNISSLVSSAAENAALGVLPITLKQAQANRLFNIMSPQRSQALELSFVTDFLKTLSALATGSSTGSSSSKGFAFNTALGGGGGGDNPSPLQSLIG